MAKQNKGNEVDNTKMVSLEDQAKGKAPVADKKADKSKRKVVKNKKTLGRKIKEIMSELKKVSWPTKDKVIKNTGVVLAVVACFLVVIVAANFVYSTILGLLV